MLFLYKPCCLGIILYKETTFLFLLLSKIPKFLTPPLQRSDSIVISQWIKSSLFIYMSFKRPRYTQSEVLFQSSLWGDKLEIREQRYTVSEHPDATHATESSELQ